MASEEITFRFGQVEELVALMLRVDDKQRSKLVGRFKQLKRLSFPPGVNITKGRFDYDLDATMRCVVAFALMNALVPAQAAVSLLDGAWDDRIADAIRSTLASLTIADGRVDLARRPEDGLFLVVATSGLSRWQSDEEGGDREGDDGDDGGDDDSPVSLSTREKLMSEVDAAAGRMPASRLLVDLWTTVATSADIMLEQGWVTPAELGLAA